MFIIFKSCKNLIKEFEQKRKALKDVFDPETNSSPSSSTPYVSSSRNISMTSKSLQNICRKKTSKKNELKLNKIVKIKTKRKPLQQIQREEKKSNTFRSKKKTIKLQIEDKESVRDLSNKTQLNIKETQRYLNGLEPKILSESFINGKL